MSTSVSRNNRVVRITGRDTDTIGLGEIPCPGLEEINSQEEFHAVTITEAEFEAAWVHAHRSA